MRRIFLLCMALSLIALAGAALAAPKRPAAPAAPAREPMTKDGQFSICEFQDFDNCQLLSDKAIKKFRLTAEENQKLKDLQRYAAATQPIPLAELEKSFGRIYRVFTHDNPNEKTLAWYRDSVGLNDLTAKCPECGVFVSLADDMPNDIFYIVDEKFTLVWYRASESKPPQ